MRKRVLPLLLALTLVQTAFSGTWSPSAHTWGGSSTDQVDGVAVDSFGNVYVAGSTQSFGAGGQDVLIIKYGPTGQFLWARTWGGSSDEFATAVKVGPDGLLYITGVTSSFGAGWFDLFLLQLDSNGNLKWGTTWGGQSYDGGHDIGFDANGNIYVVGESYSTGPCCTAVLLKFSRAGALVQSSYYKGPATYDSGYSLAVDSSFNVVVTGISWDYSIPPLHNSILLLKYDPNGNLIWQENWATTFPGQDESWAFHDVTTDAANNIYIAGRHASDCNNSNFGVCDFDTLLIKLDQNGIFQWANTWGTTGSYDTAGSVLLNTAQAPMVAGMLDEYGTPLLFILDYDATGNLLSETEWRGGNVQPGSAAGMASDASGALYLASSALNNQGSWAATTANSGVLPNSLIKNSYTTGDPNLSMTSLTTPTISQIGGVHDTGGGGADALVIQSSVWQPVKSQPPGLKASTALLLTDGSVLVQQYCSPQWGRLVPDNRGSYVNGRWEELADSPYGPLFYASAVLPTGEVIVEGGEYVGDGVSCPSTKAETPMGAIFYPPAYWTADRGTWRNVSPPQGWNQIGDAASVVLDHGLFMIACGGCDSSHNKSQALTRDGSGWVIDDGATNGKSDANSEEGWTLLPGGDVLTVDVTQLFGLTRYSEIYDPHPLPGHWSGAGDTPQSLVNIWCTEIGPAVLRPDMGEGPTVFAIGANGNTAIYDVNTGGWLEGPPLKGENNATLGVTDGPAALLPSGNVLFAASPIPPCYSADSTFFEFDGVNLNKVASPPNGGIDAPFKTRMLVLPTGQILFTDWSSDVEVYTSSGKPQDSWRPTIAYLTDPTGMTQTTTLMRGQTYKAYGTQFNGLSQGAMYGDDAQMATNYPLVRITDQGGNIFYARTHDHSSMGVATGSNPVWTYFDVPPCPSVACLESGPAMLEVVANGIPSKKYAITLE